MTMLALALALAALAGTGEAFYLPGIAPHEYARGDEVLLKVNKLTSMRTQLPYDYYSLPMCIPEEGVHEKAENLGEHLTGNVIMSTLLRLPFACLLACRCSGTRLIHLTTNDGT